jgi:hypothetical protein
MVSIRFKDPATEAKSLGWLAGRFSFTTLASGETVVPEAALAALAQAGIAFSVEGVATYAQRVPQVRIPATPQVQ